MTWERITVRRVPPDSFIGEARLHCHFAVGAICKSPFDAFTSASEAMEKEIAHLRAKPSARAKKTRAVTPDLDDLL